MAVSVANYGHEAYFVSKLPKHDIGQIAINALLVMALTHASSLVVANV